MRSAVETRRRPRPATPARARRAGVAVSALLVAALAGAAYVNALDNPFVYDDRDTVAANPSIADLSNVRFVLVYSPFRPVVNLSYAVDRALWGAGPRGFHGTNVLLHAATAALLFLFVLRALGERRTPDPAAGERDAMMAAFAAAAIFAVHPMMTEAVGYISGRSEVMCAFWFIAALLLARRALANGTVLPAIGAAACGVAALGSKETAVALPVVVLGYDWLLRPGRDEARRRRLWRFFVPLSAVVTVAALYRLSSLPASGSSAPVLNALTQAIVIWRYIALLAMPVGQTIMHGAHRVATVADPLGALAVLALVALAAIGYRLRRAEPLVPLGMIWFFAALAPSSSFVGLQEVMAEHRVYLASGGAMLAVAAAARRVLAAWPVRTPVVLGGLAVVVAVLLTATLARNRVWASPVALWTEAVAASPDSWESHYALADALREAGQCERALPEYDAALAKQPSNRDAHVNRGICLAQLGRLAEAEQAFRRALEIDPRFVRGYTNLGALALVAGDPERARDYYREAIAQDPDNVLARLQLAKLYEQVFQEYGRAAQMCGEARLIAPATPGVVECVERNQRLEAGKGR